MMNLTMKTVVMGQTVVDNRDGKTWTIIEKNSKGKTIMMEDADGATRSFGLTTVNRNFTEVEEPAEVEDREVIKVDGLTADDLAEAAPAEEPKKEKKKEKKERKPRKPMDRTAQVEFEKALAEVTKEFGITEKRWDKIKNLVAFRDGKKTFAEIRFTRKGIKINTKEFIAKVMEFVYHNQKNYYLPATVEVIPYEEGLEVIRKMLAYI